MRIRLLAVMAATLALLLGTGTAALRPTTAAAATCPCTVWSSTTTPGTLSDPDTSAIEVGVKFQADVNGFITGLRFYKSTANTGTHVGNLWSSTRTKLATATFTGETASGWQQVSFSPAVAVTAKTTYVASYHTNVGHYSVNENYFTSTGVDNSPLHALRSGVSGANGVYAYGAGGFPSNSYAASNYWVDVVFNQTATDTPTVTSTSPASGATGVAVSGTITATFSKPMQPSTIVFGLKNSGGTTIAGGTSYNASTNVATFTPSAALANSTTYTATVSGAKDLAGNPMSPVSWSFTTAAAAGVRPEPAGWFAGDPHVHRSCGGPPETVASMLQKMDAEDLRFISLLADMGNGEVQNPTTDLPLVNGQDASVSTANRTVHWDAEWHWDATYTQYDHQALGGHVVCLGLNQAYQIWQENTDPIFNWAHQQNGIAGFAHMQYLPTGIPQSLDCCTPIEYPVEAALGSANFISEDVSKSGDTAIQAYYRLLNTGFRPGFAAGTDYPCGPSVGSLLTYAQVGSGQTTYRNWIDAIANGRTVISRNGHNEFLNLAVNNTATPGDQVNLASAGSVPVAVTWTAKQNLSGTIELVQNGNVVASKQASVTSGSPATLTATVNFAKSGWLAARRMDSNGHQVHTAAVFVIVNNAPIRTSVADAQFYEQWMDNLLAKTSPGGEWNHFFVNNLAEAQNRYRQAKAVFQQIEQEASGPSTPVISSFKASPTTITPGQSSTLSWSVSGNPAPTVTVDNGVGDVTGLTSKTVSPSQTTTYTLTAQNSQGTVTATAPVTVSQNAPQTIFTTQTPAGYTTDGANVNYELGTRFTSTVNGQITAVRFYKAPSEGGTHTGRIWNASGQQLASVVFSGETASGWQEQALTTPLAITANTEYMATVNTGNAYYSTTDGGLNSQIINGYLKTMVGSNGRYGPVGAYPTNSWQNSDYFRDVVFTQ